MKTVDADQTPATTAELVERASQEPILFRDSAGRSFLITAVEESDAEALTLAGDPTLSEILERSRARAESEGWLTTAQLRRQLGIPESIEDANDADSNCEP